MNPTLRLPRDRVNALEPAEVEAHLLAHGWQADLWASSSEVGVYHHPNDPDAEIQLPRDKSFIDFALRMSEVLQALAAAEQRKAWEVLDELANGQAGSAPNGAEAKKKLAPAFDALIRKRLEGDEMVLGWREFPPGELTVWLIRKELHRVCAPIAKKFGIGAGCGRMLSFKLQDGEWVFLGVGGWIS
jgi:hypothetical protein